jgi:hypothetical protein
MTSFQPGQASNADKKNTLLWFEQFSGGEAFWHYIRTNLSSNRALSWGNKNNLTYAVL